MANAGIRIFNEQSSYIIDGQYTNPSMVRKGVGTFARESTASEDVVGKVYVQLAAGEVLAFSSQVYCGIAGYDGQFAFIATENPNIGRTVEWYVFRMGDPGSTNPAGLRVFDERGSKIYDSAWKILRVVGVLRMGDRMAVPAGRKYAFVALQVRITVERSQSGGPNTQLPNIVVRRTLAEGPRNANGVLDLSNRTVLGQWSRTYFPGNNTVVGWNGTFLNGLTTQYLVIDVTGF